MKYMLMRYENDREVMVSMGNSLEGMRQTVKNSPGFFKNGHVIYEMNVVEYGV